MSFQPYRWIATIAVAAAGVGLASCNGTAIHSLDRSGSAVGPNSPSSSDRAAQATPGEGSRAEPPAPSAPAATDSPAREPSPPTQPGEIAEAWLESLSKRDVVALTRQTLLPFTVRDQEVEQRCSRSRVTDPASLGELVSCMGENTLLIKDLAAGSNLSPTEEMRAGNGLPRWARRWKREVQSGDTPVAVTVSGNGLTHELILLVNEGGVHALWRNAIYDPN